MLIAGVDEVGRGPLAGPVIAAAVILNKKIRGIADSKILTPEKRESLASRIREKALCYAYGRAEVSEIDELNIHFATLLAMKRAIEALPIIPGEVLIDGIHTPKIEIPCRAVVKGDTFIKEIGAASIIAKVHRDAEMETMEQLYPGYNFAKHKGYATKSHQMALKKLGPCKIHRKNFQQVILALNNQSHVVE